MEDAIQNAEKLVHATNTALAQMKYNMDFDELPKNSDADSKVFLEKIRHNRRKKKNQFLPIQEELEKFENEARIDTNFLLSSMDDLLNPEHYLSARKNTQQFKIIDKIQEINKIIESKREQLADAELESEIRKHKPDPRIQFDDEEFRRQVKGVPEKLASTPTIVESDKSSRTSFNKTFTVTKPKKAEVTEDLRKKLLQTEEVVDRGFQTVRQLNKKLDTLKKHDRKIEKAQSSDKISFSSKSPRHFSPKSVSTETVKSFDCKKVRDKRKKEKKLENVSMLDVKWSERRRHHEKKLKFQRLPSLHIRNGLKLQKIPSIDIPPHEEEQSYPKSNVVVKNLIYNEGEGKNLEKLYSEIYDEKRKEKSMECVHCGRLIRIFESDIRSRDIDELLVKCNFDVFDPRIEEFVKQAYQSSHRCRRDENFETDAKISVTKEKQERRKKKQEKEFAKYKGKAQEEDLASEKNESVAHTQVKISQLGEELSRKYREKTMKIESDYLEFENVIRDIFRKVDKSREVFESTKFFSAVEKSPEPANKSKRLSITKPVVLELKNFKTDLKMQTDKVPKVDKKTEVEKEFLRKIEEFKKENRKEKKKVFLKGDKTTQNEKGFLRDNEELNNEERKIENKLSLKERNNEIEKEKEFLRKMDEITKKKKEENKISLNELKSNTLLVSPENSSGSEKSRFSKKSSKSSESSHKEKNEMDFLEFLRTSNKIEPEKTSFLPTSPKFIPPELWKPPLSNKISKPDVIESPSPKDSKSDTSSSSDRAKFEENSESFSKKNDVQTDEDYQSDFEVESLENSIELPFENEINIPAIDLSSLEQNKITKNVNKLPTISEKDSEAEKKISSSTVSEITSERTTDAESKEVEKILQVGQEVSSKNMKEEKENKAEPQADRNFYRKADESLKEVLDEAFEKGASYMLERQRDILDLNYKATRRKSSQKKNKNLKKPDVELFWSSTSDKPDRSESDNQVNTQKSSAHLQQSVKTNKHQDTQKNSPKNENLPKEMFTSLKELLDALKTQFAKTEVLTEKLTENVQSKKDEKRESPTPALNSLNPLENLKYVNNIIFNNLQKNRKEFTMNENMPKSRNIFTQKKEEDRSDFPSPKFLNLSPKNLDNLRLGLPIFEKRKIEKISPTSNFSHSSKEDKSLSSGEIVGNSFVRKKDCITMKNKKGKRSSWQNDSASDSHSDKVCKSSRLSHRKINDRHEISRKSPVRVLRVSDSISEGEVPSAGLIDDKYDSSQSIGEVISEQILTESIDEDGSR